jgi:hypothetical protein
MEFDMTPTRLPETWVERMTAVTNGEIDPNLIRPLVEDCAAIADLAVVVERAFRLDPDETLRVAPARHEPTWSRILGHFVRSLEEGRLDGDVADLFLLCGKAADAILPSSSFRGWPKWDDI